MGNDNADRVAAMEEILDGPVMAGSRHGGKRSNSVEKLQIAITQNSGGGALQSTIRSTNRRSACQKTLGRAQQSIERPKERRLCGPGIS